MKSPWDRHIVLVSERKANALASFTRSVTSAARAMGLIALSVSARMRAPRASATRTQNRVSFPYGAKLTASRRSFLRMARICPAKVPPRPETSWTRFAVCCRR